MNCPLYVGTPTVYDKSEHYYAIGNTHPTQLLPKDVKNPKILCLGAGDPRSCLYSIALGPVHEVESVTFVINDKNAAIIARNVVLLCLALRPEDFSCEPMDLWELWYSLFISKDLWQRVSSLLRLLVEEGSDKLLLESFHICITDTSTLQTCREIWTMWQEMSMAVSEAESMRDKYMCQRLRCNRSDFDRRFKDFMICHFARQGYIGGAFVFPDGPVFLPGLHRHSHLLHVMIPTFDFDKEIFKRKPVGECAVNKTLFMDSDRYNAHYTTMYFQSYPLWKFCPQDETLEDFCRKELKYWTRQLRASCRKIKFEFFQGDCLSVCLSNVDWCDKFDVIDTGNLSDHVGLPSLLLICRPLIKEDGVMFSSSMTPGADGEVEYLEKQLASNKAFWSALYGWHCRGHEPGVQPLHIEWPLVSNHAVIHLQWTPSCYCELPGDETVLDGLVKHIRDQSSIFLVGTGVGLGILFLIRNTAEPLEFLQRHSTELPRAKITEIELWLSIIESRVGADHCSSLEFNIGESVDLCNIVDQVYQPWLKACGIYKRRRVEFGCISLARTSSGKTTKASVVIPYDLPSESIALYNFNAFHCKLPLKATVSRVASASLKTVVWMLKKMRPRRTATVSQIPTACNQANQPCPRYCIKGPYGATSLHKIHGQARLDDSEGILSVAATAMMLRRDLLASRRAPGSVRDDDPLLSIKELVMNFIVDGKQKSVVCVNDGTGVVPLVIVKEGVYQDDLLGTPVIDLTFFFPTKPFPSDKHPQKLERHHPDDDFIHTCTMRRKTCREFKQIVELLSGAFQMIANAWGMEGLIQRCLFPAIYPARQEALAEKGREINFLESAGVLGIGNDRANVVMKALKDHGNTLLKEGLLQDAIFAYTLGALKIESAGVQDEDSEIQKLAAQCHCNLAHVQLQIGTNEAMAAAIRSCDTAIRLQPKWEKPYFRRGICYEKQEAHDLAKRDFAMANRCCPGNKEIKAALIRLCKIFVVWISQKLSTSLSAHRRRGTQWVLCRCSKKNPLFE